MAEYYSYDTVDSQRQELRVRCLQISCVVFFFLISVPFYVKIPIFPSAHKPLPVLFTRADGVMRTMNTEKLIKTLPVIQNQLDALLDFQVDMT